MRSVRVLALAVIGLGIFGLGHAFGARQATDVVGITLPLQFPAVGNIDAVHEWRFARLERADPPAANDDVVLHLRTGDGVIHRVVSPRGPMRALASASNWISTPTKTTASQTDYVERMVAFDMDETNRLIAIASLEPVVRNRSRLRRVFGGR